MRSSDRGSPLAYLLTWHPYGTWLPGDARGWHRRGDGPSFRQPDPGLQFFCAATMRAAPLILSSTERRLVLDAVHRTCLLRRWPVYGVVVAPDHVHLVVSAPMAPEAVLAQLKSWATRALRERAGLDREQPVWARHGSTRYLFDENSLRRAIRYVAEHG